MNHLLIIDVSAIFYRAHFASKGLSRQSDGMLTGGLMGLSRCLMRTRKGASEQGYTHAIAAFDPGGKTWRHELEPSYKANRTRSDDIRMPRQHLPIIPAMFGIKRVAVPGFEADDIVATAARMAIEEGWRVTVMGAPIPDDKPPVTDKDFYHLLNHGVRIIEGNGREVTQAACIEKWGVAPADMIELQTLMGDASDGVPGLPFVGEGTARKLLEQYGRSNDVPWDALPKRTRATLGSHEAMAHNIDLTRKLVTLRTDVPLGEVVSAHHERRDDGRRGDVLLAQPMLWGSFALQAPRFDMLISFCQSMEFIDHLAEVEAWSKMNAW